MSNTSTHIEYFDIKSEEHLMGYKADTYVPIEKGEIITLEKVNRHPDIYNVDDFNSKYEVVKINKEFIQTFLTNKVCVEQLIMVYLKKVK